MALESLRLTALKLLGRFPKTEAIEARDSALRDEYREFTDFAQSDELKHFISLKEFVESGEPKRAMAELKSLKYNNSEEQMKEEEYKKLLKMPALRNYFRVKDSKELELYQSVELSVMAVRLKDIAEIVESDQYKADRRSHVKGNTDEYRQELEYRNLKKNKDLTRYHKVLNWKPLLDYLDIKSGCVLDRLEYLKNYLQSTEFKERKAYLNLSQSQKYKKSEAYRKELEYKQLAKSDRIKWYFSLLSTKKFDEIKRWELTFADDFTDKSLDMGKWMTRYFWGEALLNRSYSLAADKHWYPDTQNITIGNSILRIETRRESVEGFAWDQQYGFIPKMFEYTSGLISTGNFFRQKGGRFEAKVRLSGAPGVYHAFWLVGDTMLPHTDVFRQKGKDGAAFQGAFYWQNGSGKAKKDATRITGIDLSSGFHILSIDWLSERIIWKINGITFREQSSNLPQGLKYIVISSGVTEDSADKLLPAQLEVDWVRCWREVK